MKDLIILIIVIAVLVWVVMFTFSLKVHATEYMRVNQTQCLLVDAYDRLYDGKDDCFIKLTQDNVKDFCKISKSVEPGWCDQSVITDLLTDRIRNETN